MKLRKICFVALILCFHASILLSQESTAELKERCGIDIELAKAYFEEFREIVQKDDGKLWGTTLNMRLMFVDPASRILVANSQNHDNTFTESDGVFLAVLKPEYGIANTSMKMYGEMWTMVSWDFLPGNNACERKWIMAHESFHGIQKEIGLPAINTDNRHLETMEGRIYLQLEFRALQMALLQDDDSTYSGLIDALLFRNYRYRLFDDALINEGRFEKHEGMAEYTGAMLSGYSLDTLKYVLAKRLKDAEGERSYQWYFAYKTGPVYAYLADEAGLEWQEKLKEEDNIALLIQKELKIDMPDNLSYAIEERINAYDGLNLIREEKALFAQKQEILKSYNTMFFEDTALQIPLAGQMNISFDPMNSYELCDLGTVYVNNTYVSASWGVLEAEGPVFLEKNWQYVILSKPVTVSDTLIKGVDWSVRLQDNWIVSNSQKQLILIKGDGL